MGLIRGSRTVPISPIWQLLSLKAQLIRVPTVSLTTATIATSISPLRSIACSNNLTMSFFEIRKEEWEGNSIFWLSFKEISLTIWPWDSCPYFLVWAAKYLSFIMTFMQLKNRRLNWINSSVIVSEQITIFIDETQIKDKKLYK